jgi:peptide/nickel transport system permease protein
VSSGPLALGPDPLERVQPPQLPAAPEPGVDTKSGRVARARRAILGDPQLAVPVGALLLMVLFAIFMPIIWNHNPDTQNLLNALQPPSSAHPMGTDELGRDVLARVAAGARISLVTATLVALAGALVGGLIGLFAGTLGGISDGVVMRGMDAVLAFPPLILAMAVTVGLGVGVTSAAIGIALVSVPWYARLLRSEALRIRSLPFIEAAYATGLTRDRIMRRHVVPHMLPSLYIQMAAAFGYAVLALAGLSFVGLGAQVPTPEWGAMMTEGLSYSLSGQWWISVFPGIAVLITVTAASALSDRLRDRLDPRGLTTGG